VNTRWDNLREILDDTWHLQSESDAYEHFRIVDYALAPDTDNRPGRYLVLSYDGGHQQHWAITTDATPDEIAASAGTDEAGYQECDVHDLDTGAHWELVPSYRARLTPQHPS
jgi:hypothetical protein